MESSPDTLTIRAYNVGFGDCFLLSFRYARNERHVLIDFGSTARPGLSPPDLMLRIASDIRNTCGGKLHAVVATHRHRDHISGFAGQSGQIIADLAPDVVVQPWTEDPDLAPNATGPLSIHAGPRGFVASLKNMELVAQQIREVQGGRGWGEAVTRQVAVLSEDNIANAEAVDNLQRMGRLHHYVYSGARDPLMRVLPAVHTRVLGPPTLIQSEAIRRRRRRDENEFWHFQARATSVSPTGKRQLFAKAATYTRRTMPPDAQVFLDRLQEARGDQLLAIVRALDNAINNTSVVLLIEAGSKRLLFPGDAQIENWSYALPRTKKHLKDVDVYKVGHHGSLNATPKTLWELFRKRGPKGTSRRLTTLLSTLPDTHGDLRRGTEVPRRKLIAELRRESNLVRTDRPDAGLYISITIDLRARQSR